MAARRKNKRGPKKPCTYSKAKAEKVLEALRNGATLATVGAVIDVSRSTIYAWRKRFPEFDEQVKIACHKADRKVEYALFQAALAGDKTAMIFWLKNRLPEHWRDVHDHKLSGSQSAPVAIVIEDKREAEEPEEGT